MTNYEKYVDRMQRIADVYKASAVLNWDQEVNMPEGSAALRARQLATISGIAYEMSVAPELVELVNDLKTDDSLDAAQKRNVQQTARSLEKQMKLSKEHVEAISAATSEAFVNWAKARKANDFSIFEGSLTKLVDLKRAEAEMIGYDDHPYDALMDEYEPGAKTRDLEVLFADVRAQLVDFVQQIQKQPSPKDEWMYRKFDHQQQWDFGMFLLAEMGYDFKTGRQDLAAHPFTIDFGSQDVRVTTRINEQDFHEMTWSCIHEGGHALYEQGLPAAQYGLPLGAAISLGIHESQSRIWENNVGRSLPFWKAYFPKLKGMFPDSLKDVSAEDFYKSMNVVRSSLIRTNADELTYHFHVMVRFEIEKALIEKQIEVKDVPAFWNEKYREYLDIEVPGDDMGCLQDIHWSHGSFGYFPTYSLGSFYAAQFYKVAKKDIPGLEDQIAAGNLKPMLEWLREQVHQHGQMYSAEELCEKITGEKLNFSYFMDYARDKYSAIYNFSPQGMIA